jgi:SAM-dependent methyltransferase
LAVTMLARCQSCGSSRLCTVADLGSQPLANALVRPDQADKPDALYPLHVQRCESCLLVQLYPTVPPEAMFVDYSYFSSFSDTWLTHCAELADAMVERLGLGGGSRVVEVGSNDGALQGCFAALGIGALGVEPAGNVARAALARGLSTEIAFFGERTARRLAADGWSADLVVATNVLAHVPDINDFVAGLRHLLKPDGRLVVEFPHLLNLIGEVQFDTIYHEHFTYLSLLSVRTIFERHGLSLVDVERQPVHGGSLRVFAAPTDSAEIERDSVRSMIKEEVAAGLDRSAGYDGFQGRVDEMRDTLAAFLARSRRDGRSIVGYGAAAKGATLLNHLGATSAEMAFVVDRNPAKQGLLLPGSHIPVRPVEALIEAKPDYVMILPWNLRDEVIRQLPQVASWGGRFVTPLPRLEIT